MSKKYYISPKTMDELEDDLDKFLHDLDAIGTSGKEGIAGWFTVDFDNYDPERKTGLSVRMHMEYGNDPRESC